MLFFRWERTCCSSQLTVPGLTISSTGSSLGFSPRWTLAVAATARPRSGCSGGSCRGEEEREGGDHQSTQSSTLAGWTIGSRPTARWTRPALSTVLVGPPPSPLLSSLASLVRQDAEPGSKCQYLLGIRGNFIRLHCRLKLGPFPADPNLL